MRMIPVTTLYFDFLGAAQRSLKMVQSGKSRHYNNLSAIGVTTDMPNEFWRT